MRMPVIVLVVLLVPAPAALADSVTGSGTAGLLGAVEVQARSGRRCIARPYLAGSRRASACRDAQQCLCNGGRAGRLRA